jgi:putative two-component system response regulator
MALAAHSVEAIFLTAPLHDIGKIRIPGRTVGKAGPLNSDEWAAVRQHCSIGVRIVRESPQIASVFLGLGSVFSPSAVASGASYLRKVAALIVLQHHERWDGNGYPQGLEGTEASLESRIAAVADAFDALTSDRPYCPAYPEEWALETIHEEAGTSFDPAVCAAFVKALPQIRSIRRRFADGPRTCPATESVDRMLAAL